MKRKGTKINIYIYNIESLIKKTKKIDFEATVENRYHTHISII